MGPRWWRGVVVAVLGVPAIGLLAQEPAGKVRVPERGDVVVAKGCLAGPTLQAIDTATVGETRRLSAPVTYRLKGPKRLLEHLRGEHDGALVEITGVLKSALPRGSDGGGKKVGRTTVTLGIGPASGQKGAPAAETALPVLEVRSYEGSETRCGAR